jgi:hypothetical protein
MFKFVVNHLGFLKHIPLFATFFDAIILLWNSVFNPKLILAVECIELELATWSGVERLPHKFGGIQFNYSGHEIGHIHSNGVLDILFSQKIKKELLAKKIASHHHVFFNSGWITFYVRSADDIENAISLLAMSYQNKITRSVCRSSQHND